MTVSPAAEVDPKAVDRPLSISRRSEPMRNTILVRLMSSMVIVALLNLGFVQSAIAAGIDTATVVSLEDRTEALARIDAQLSRSDVRDALIGLGVDPAQAKIRVGALTDAEVTLLDRELAQLPAA